MSDEEARRAIQELTVDGCAQCEDLLALAARLGVPAGRLGRLCDEMDVRIINCQLGCFGSTKATHEDLAGFEPDAAVSRAIEGRLSDGRLPCPEAFGIAASMKIRPKVVGDTATFCNVKVSRCQLGCFP